VAIRAPFSTKRRATDEFRQALRFTQPFRQNGADYAIFADGDITAWVAEGSCPSHFLLFLRRMRNFRTLIPTTHEKCARHLPNQQPASGICINFERNNRKDQQRQGARNKMRTVTIKNAENLSSNLNASVLKV
jgi:hypothetical protein